jgi:hypothetical protein
MNLEHVKNRDFGKSASHLMPSRRLLGCTPKGVQAAGEMLRVANNLQRG